MNAADIAGYVYRADIYCPDCILEKLPTGPGEAFDGWADATGSMTAEQNLSELAAAFGIDRDEETTFDSDDFPKVVFADQIDGDSCGHCCEVLP